MPERTTRIPFPLPNSPLKDLLSAGVKLLSKTERYSASKPVSSELQGWRASTTLKAIPPML
jgi:hypothetical protein